MQETLKTYSSSYLFDHLDSTDVLPYREVAFTDDITTVFGGRASVAGGGVTKALTVSDIRDNQNIVSEALGFAIIIFVMALYMIMLTLCGRVIPELFKSFTYKDNIDRLVGMFDVNMERLLRMSDFLIHITVAYIVMILSKYYLDISFGEVYVFVLMLIVGIIYVSYNFLFIKTLRYISENDDFFDNLSLLNRSNAAMATIIFLPIAILVSFADLSGVNSLTICLMTMSIVFVIHYLITVLKFFKQQNVSFLEYILYLCGAEVIPISFVIIFTLRNYDSQFWLFLPFF